MHKMITLGITILIDNIMVFTILYIFVLAQITTPKYLVNEFIVSVKKRFLELTYESHHLKSSSFLRMLFLHRH